MAAFPDYYEIRTSRLISLWVAEGFLKPNGDKSFEEVAEDYLKALVDRNLVSIVKKKSNGKAKSYSIHDLMRDLCLKTADHERFLYVMNDKIHNVGTRDSFYSLHRMGVHPTNRVKYIHASEEFMSHARSFLCIGLESHTILSPVFFGLRLLRVLDILDMQFHRFPTQILQLVNLRYLAFFSTSVIPSTISRLCNLETLIVGTIFRRTGIPTEIWEMSELRHLKIKGTFIHIQPGKIKNLAQEKLQKISSIFIDELFDPGFFRSIPNIKNLGIFRKSEYGVVDLSDLHKLETLRCFFNLGTHTSLSTLTFPTCVRKLSLYGYTIPWKSMETLCSLPNLEVLRIHSCTFEGEDVQVKDEQEWEVTEEEFSSLQCLKLENLKLVHWRAHESNFPKLRHLVIRLCYVLEEIPPGIGEISTLEIIEVDKLSSASAVASARQIRDGQRDNGNYDLQVRII